MKDLNLDELASIFAEMDEVTKNNTLANIMRTIKQIDRDNNGYVTTTELDDILKLNFPQLENRKIKAMMREYESIQNKILIDYKRFRDQLLGKIKFLREKKQQEAAVDIRKGKIAEKL